MKQRVLHVEPEKAMEGKAAIKYSELVGDFLSSTVVVWGAPRDNRKTEETCGMSVALLTPTTHK